MAKQTKEQILPVKLYTSLMFWGGLLLLFFLTFLILFSRKNNVIENMKLAATTLILMPSIFQYFLHDIRPFGTVGSFGTFHIVVWLVELAGIAWLKFKASTLKNSTIIIIGTIILLLLVTQFVGCALVISTLLTG